MSARDPSSVPSRRPLGLEIRTQPADFIAAGPGIQARRDTGWVWLQISDRNQTIVHNAVVRDEEIADEVAVAVKRYTKWEDDLVAQAQQETGA